MDVLKTTTSIAENECYVKKELLISSSLSLARCFRIAIIIWLALFPENIYALSVEEKQQAIFYVVYDHPTDYPEHFVVRLWVEQKDGKLYPTTRFWLSHTLQGARNIIALETNGKEAVMLPRSEKDDPAIVESWFNIVKGFFIEQETKKGVGEEQ